MLSSDGFLPIEPRSGGGVVLKGVFVGCSDGDPSWAIPNSSSSWKIGILAPPDCILAPPECTNPYSYTHSEEIAKIGECSVSEGGRIRRKVVKLERGWIPGLCGTVAATKERCGFEFV
jgi:hypothetical protein